MKATRAIVLIPGDLERFHAKVAPADANGCALWTASLNNKGYGEFRLSSNATRNTRPFMAHRVAYTIANGPIPDGLHIDHMCHVPACVSPAHLRLATHAENHQNLNGATARSTSGFRGVFLNSRNGKWRAEATVGGRRKVLGTHDTAEDANETVVAWRREHMPYSVLDQVPA